MIVLHVISSMDPTLGGVSQAVRTIIRGLDEAESCHSEIVSLDSPDSGFLRSDPIPPHALGPSRTAWAYSAALVPWLLENLPRFDAVIVHGLWQYPGYAVRKALDNLRRAQPATDLPRCHVMPHGMLDPYFQRDPSRRMKAIRNLIYWIFIEHKVVNEADGLLFTCEDERLLARKPFHAYHPKRESVVGLGVEDPPDSTPAMKAAFGAACAALGDRPYLLFLSRIHPKKGVDLLIRAYADLAKSSSQPSILNSQPPLPSLVIAGPLDSDYAREMQQLAAELLPDSCHQPSTFNHQPSPSPRIHFPGMLSGDAKWGAFHGCESFILPSHQENFGIAVVEALACGKPVLISNKVNIWREILADGGGVAEDDSFQGTTSLLKQWICDTASRPTSSNARRCYVDHYSIGRAAKRLAHTI